MEETKKKEENARKSHTNVADAESRKTAEVEFNIIIL